MAFTKDGIRLAKPTDVTSPAPHKIYPGYASSSGEDVIGFGQIHATDIPDRVAVKAIEGLLRSWRTVGRTQITVQDVAKSLSLPFGQVERITSKLQGVKIVK